MESNNVTLVKSILDDVLTPVVKDQSSVKRKRKFAVVSSTPSSLSESVLAQEAEVVINSMNRQRNLASVGESFVAKQSKLVVTDSNNKFLTSTPIVQVIDKPRSAPANDRDHSEYLRLEQDYSHRPRRDDIDWSMLDWIHPDHVYPPPKQ